MTHWGITQDQDGMAMAENVIAAVRTRLAQRFSLISLVAFIAVFASVVPAVAAPETPSAVEVQPVTNSSSAFVTGVLNPGKAGEPGTFELGTYEFLFRASKVECKGESHAPASPGMSLGGGEERVSEFIEGLQPDTEYTICLLARSNEGTPEEATSVGSPAHFRTAIPVEQPEAKPATEVTGSSATLNAVLNPHNEAEPGSYRFIYAQSSSECEPGPELEAQPALGKHAEAVSANLTGLLPKTTYTFCVQARNQSEEVAVSAGQTFTTAAAAPTVVSETVAKLSSSEATVSAEISPSGEPTTYEVEYEAGRRTPAQSLPAGTVPIAVSQHLTELSASSEYHYRFIAHNALGSTEGALEAFTTAATAISGGSSSCPNSTLSGYSAALPDCRAVELVSPAAEVGDVYDPGGSLREEDITTARPFRAAAAGGAVAYLADPGPVGGDGSSAKGRGNQYIAVRGPLAGPQGWETSNITPPVAEGESASAERAYVSLSDDLMTGLVASEEPLLGAHPTPQGPGSCSVLYSHTNRGTGLGGEFQALFTETETPGYCGEIQSPKGVGTLSALLFAGESADQAQKFLQTPARLTPTASEPAAFGSNLYDSHEGHLSLVNESPEGEVYPNATFGGPSGLSRNDPNLSRAISADGSRVFWSSLMRSPLSESRGVQPLALYAREQPSSPSAHTVELDVPQGGASGASGGGQFWTASSDGSKVFFTDCSRLTVDSTASSSQGCWEYLPAGVHPEVLPSGNDLYVYDFTKPAGERLVDITVDANAHDPLGANVQGVIGVSDDGTYVYFIASGALESVANANGEKPEARKCEKGPTEAGYSEARGHLIAGLGCNLYVEHNNGRAWEEPRFIAALGAGDNEHGFPLNSPKYSTGQIYGDWASDLGSRTAEVSPDGRHVVFMSLQQLTGYDAIPGAFHLEFNFDPGDEVFVYDATSNRLSCASCAQTGAPPPLSVEAPAGFLPVSSSDTFMHRWMNAEGTEVFFDSIQPLASGDDNNRYDVYEWKADGTSGCPNGAGKYGGCVFLLSGGESSDFSFLVDVSENGEDVFLTHRGQLDGAGPRDGKVHLYDVRTDGGFPNTATACTGTGCQGAPPALPEFATPASATFGGIGNYSPATVAKGRTAAQIRAARLATALSKCRKTRARHKRAACERQAHKRYGTRSGKSKAGQRRSK